MNSPAACLQLVERITRRYAPKLSHDLRSMALTPEQREKLFAEGKMKMLPPPPVSGQIRYVYRGAEVKKRALSGAVFEVVKHLQAMERIPHGYMKQLCRERGVNYNTVHSRLRHWSPREHSQGAA